MEAKPAIPEFFAGKSVLITGASGFMGKVLVEKLLRCCPRVRNIYIILRRRGDKSPEERWEEMTKLPVFDRLKMEFPENLKKIVVLEGDVAEKNLGLAIHHQIILEEEISIVFHSAASVRFDDPLGKAIFLNTRGTLESIKLAERMKNLQCYLYVSTAFSNSNLNISGVEEKIYPAKYDYKMLIELFEKSGNPSEIELLSNKIMDGHPNTYTFSKSLAEQVMSDYFTKIPIVVIRPSVVINSIHEPTPGWMENLNGPMGMVAGVSKGVLRVFMCNEDCYLDYVAVDYAINSFIVSAWHKAVVDERTKKQLTVYNCVYGNVRSATFGDLIHSGPAVYNEAPYLDILWYPSIITTTNTVLFTFLFYILQIIPSILLDSVLWLFNYNTMFLKINRKIYIASFALQRFSTKLHTFSNKHFQSLWATVNEKDEKIFFMNPPEELTESKIMKICHNGMRKFYFHESESDIPKARVKFNRLYWADRILRLFFISSLLWLSSKIIVRMFQIFVR